MSIRHIAECFYTTTLQPNERLIAIALADYADDHGRAFPSLANISAKTGYSRRQTQRLVKQLEKLGYVEILYPAAWNRTPIYQLHPEALARPERITDTPLPLPPAETIDRLDRGDDNLTPPHDTGGTKGVTPRAPGGDTGVTLNRHEPSPEPSQPSAEDGEGNGIPIEGEPNLVHGNKIERVADTTATAVEPADRNPAWDALEEVFGYRPEGSEAGLWGKICVRANTLPDPYVEVRTRATRIVAQWGAKSLTPGALHKWWDRFGTPLGAATDADSDRLKAELDKENRLRRAEENYISLPPDDPQRLEELAEIKALDKELSE